MADDNDSIRDALAALQRQAKAAEDAGRELGHAIADLTFAVRKLGTTTAQTTIHVHGITDPRALAQQVAKHNLKRGL